MYNMYIYVWYILKKSEKSKNNQKLICQIKGWGGSSPSDIGWRELQ